MAQVLELPPLKGRSGPLDEGGDMPTATRDKTALPNWAMPIIVGIFIALLGFVYTTVDRRIEDKQKEIDRLERRLDTQETFMKNTREQLIAHGWTVDDSGVIKPPTKR